MTRRIIPNHRATGNEFCGFFAILIWLQRSFPAPGGSSCIICKSNSRGRGCRGIGRGGSETRPYKIARRVLSSCQRRARSAPLPVSRYRGLGEGRWVTSSPSPSDRRSRPGEGARGCGQKPKLATGVRDADEHILTLPLASTPRRRYSHGQRGRVEGDSMSGMTFRERLDQGSAILADGAMGTLLHARGVPIEACFDELNLSSPALVLGIHTAYLDAGAEVIETNTFGANRFKLAEYGLEDRVAEINRAGVRLARQAIKESGRADAYVAGSVGPLGVRLAPFGRVSAEQAREAFREQIAALCGAGADLIILETFSDLAQPRAAAHAAREVCDLPIVAQVTFTRDDRTLLGDTPQQAALALADLDVDLIGANCSGGPAQIMRVVQQMRAALPPDAPVRFSAMPNAGW